jgi:hypothetical protein
MKHQLKKIFAIVGLTVGFVSVSQAQWYLAGDWQTPLTWQPGATPMVAGPNAGEFSYTITGGTAGAYGNCKVTDGTWNNTWPGNNLYFLYDSTGSATIHFWPGNSTDGWTPLGNRVGYDDPNNSLGWGFAGPFNSWSGTDTNLLSIGNGVYSNSIVVTGPANTDNEFKFQSPAGSWSDIYFGADFGNNNANGVFTTTSNPQTLPVVLDLPGGRYYVGAPALPPTNYITFQLDMSEEVAGGNFTNTDLNPSDPNFGQPVNSVAIAGSYMGWGTQTQLTNAPILNPADTRTNLYIATIPIQKFLPYTLECKFRVNNLDGGYEQPVSTHGSDRFLVISNANQVLSFSYDDLGAGDLTVSSITVTFSVLITNGTPDITGYQFIKGTDFPYISGSWLGWPTWGYNVLPANQQMVEVGASDVYTNSFLIPRGGSIYMTYKYSYNGVDDENGANTNHIREIRSYGPTYSFPQDVWSWTVINTNLSSAKYPNPGITSTNIVEPDFGYLAAGAPSGGHIPITWLGRPGVVLQNSSNLTGSWNNNSATDGTQATNWPNAGGNQFFRLIKN